VLKEIGAKPSARSDQEGKPELLLLNKTDTAEGEENAPFWRTLHPDAIPISAKTVREWIDCTKPSTSSCAGSNST
jgi:50S ribosomal subunit-associated GTPase HflX